VEQVESTPPSRAAVRAPSLDGTTVAICAVFLLASAFYLWTVATTSPLALSGGQVDPYNQLANAFLHFHLSVGSAPKRLVNLPEPYDPKQNEPFQALDGGIHDFVLYKGKLFLTWGPTPAIAFLVPLHLLGLQPTSSVTASFFAIMGLGFALATLRVMVRQIREIPVWMSVLAALTLALASAIPFILRRPAVYEEEITAGYTFVMAGIWLAIRAVVDRRASLKRLALMSLCFGLAVGARPTLVFAAAVMVPVYLALRGGERRRGLLLALSVPFAACLLLLLTYNQARFGSPLQNGAKYQLAGLNQYRSHFGSLSYMPPGLWFYGLSLPRATSIFPFLILTPHPIPYPGHLLALYAELVEPTGGLLPMAPIVVFIVALPWIWRRNNTSLGRLALPLLVLAGAGVACVLFLIYELFSATERYEVDFTTLLLLGALATWLALYIRARGWRRRLLMLAGGVLAAWSCIAGLAISFTGYYNLLAATHPGTWRTLEDVGSPISRVIVSLEGHPVLAEVTSPEGPILPAGQRTELVIASSDSRVAAVRAEWVPALRSSNGGLSYAKFDTNVLLRGPGKWSSMHRVLAGGETVQIPVSLTPGVNRVVIDPLPTKPPVAGEVPQGSEQLLYVKSFVLVPHG
jgi:hypothetical protein